MAMMRPPFLLLLLLPIALVGSFPSSLSVCDVADLSPCQSFIKGVASEPSDLCCKQLSPNPKCLCSILQDGASAVAELNETQALALRRCFDGSGATKSPAKCPRGNPDTSTHDTDGLCPDCEKGSIDPGLLIPPPTPPSELPQKP